MLAKAKWVQIGCVRKVTQSRLCTPDPADARAAYAALRRHPGLEGALPRALTLTPYGIAYVALRGKPRGRRSTSSTLTCLRARKLRRTSSAS